MSVDRDYAVGIGLQLADDSIETVSAEIKAALAKIPALQLKVGGIADLQRLATTMQSVTNNSGDAVKAISRTSSAINATTEASKAADKATKDAQRSTSSYARDSFNDQVKLNNELERSLNLFSRMNNASRDSAVSQGIKDGRSNFPASVDKSNAAMFSGAPVDDLMARNRAATQSMGNAVNSVFANMSNEINKATQSEEDFNNAISRGMKNASASSSAKANSDLMERYQSNRGPAEAAVQFQALNSEIDKNNEIINRNIGQLNAAAEAHRQLTSGMPAEIAGYSGITDQLTHQLVTFAEWAAMAKLVEGASHLMTKGITDAMQSQREQVLQSFYYQAQGKSFDPTTSASTMNAAISMSRLYGDEVMHVQEAIGLWAKDTNGELVPALAMANSALKLNAVSGMDMEQIFRETNAVLAQTNLPLSQQAHLYDVAVAAATRYGGAMQSLEGQSDDMVKQMLEGISEAAVEFGKVGMSIDQMGGMIAITVHDFGEKTSGSSGGKHLADAMAGITSSVSAIKALNAAGISLHDNNNFIDEVAEHWKTLGTTIDSSIRKTDRPIFDNVIKNVKQLDDAVKHFEDTGTDGILDKLLEKTMGTAAFQAMQLKTGFEALGIVIGKDVLPQVQAMLTASNGVIPVLIEWHKGISDIGESGAKIAGIALGISVLRTVFASGVRFVSNFADTLRGTAAAEEMAATPLKAYQKQLLSTLTVSGEVTPELEAQIKTVALQTNTSVDQVIMALGRMQGVFTETAGVVETDSRLMGSAVLGIGKSMDITALQTEGATAAMKTQMGSLAVAGESSAIGIAAAFSKIIPIVGGVIMAIQLGMTAKQMWDDRNAANETKHMKADPAYRQQMMHSANVDYQQANSQLSHSQYSQDLLPFGQYIPSNVRHVMSFGAEPDAPSEDDLRNRANRDQQVLQEGTQAAAMGSQSSSLKEIQAELKKQAAEAALALHQMRVTPPGNVDTGPLATKAGRGPSAASQQATALQQVKAANADILAQESAKISADDAAIARAKSILEINSLTAAGVKNLSQAYAQEEKDLQAQIKSASSIASQYEKQHAALLSKASAAGIGSKAGQEYSREASNMERQFATTTTEVGRLKDALVKLQATHAQVVLEFNRQLQKGDTLGLQGTYNNDILGLKGEGKNASASDLLVGAKDATTLADALEQAAKGYDNMGSKQQAIGEALRNEEQKVRSNAESWKQRADTIKQNAQDLDASLQSSLQDQQIDMANPYDQHVQEAFRSLMALEKQYEAQMTTLRLANDTAGMSAEKMWADNQAGILQSKLALQEYDSAVANMKSNPMFGAVTGALDSVGNSLASSFEGSIDGSASSNTQILALQNQVTSLENERNLLQGQYYDTQRIKMENEANEINNRIKELQQVAQNPSLGKKLMDDLTKGLTDGFMKELEDTLKQGLINQFIPKLNDANTQQKKTVDEFNQVVNGQLKQSFQQWQDAWDKGVPSMDKLSAALTNFQSGTVTDNDGTPIGAISGLSNTLDGTDPINMSLNGGTAGDSAAASSLNSTSLAMGGNFKIPSAAIAGGAAALAVIGGGMSSIFGSPASITGTGSGTVYYNSDGTEVTDGSLVDPNGFTDASNAEYSTDMPVYGTNVDPGVTGDMSNINNPTTTNSPLSAFGLGSLSGIPGIPAATDPKSGQGPSMGNYMNAFGDAAGMYAGYQQGGIAGGLETGVSAFAGMSQFGVPPQIALPVAAALGIFAAFSHHDNQAEMPDKYDTQDYGQTMADMMGSGFGTAQQEEANGSMFSENSTLRSSIGSQGELSYIAEFLQNNPSGAKQVLTPEELAMFQGLKVGAGNIIGGGNGSETLANGQSVQWQQLSSSVQSAVSAIQQFTNSANAANAPLIAIQAFGSGKGGAAFSPYYTPGFGNYYSDYMKNTPYYAANASPTNANGGVNGSFSMPSQTPGGSRITGPGGNLQLTNNLVLGGRQLAQVIQNIRYQQTSAGLVLK